MAPNTEKIEKLRKDIQRLERKISEVDEEMDVLEVRLLNAKGSKKTALEKKIEKLDLKWEKLDSTLTENKKQLAAIDPTYKYESGGEDSDGSGDEKKVRKIRSGSGSESSGDERKISRKNSKSPREISQSEEEQEVHSIDIKTTKLDVKPHEDGKLRKTLSEGKEALKEITHKDPPSARKTGSDKEVLIIKEKESPRDIKLSPHGKSDDDSDHKNNNNQESKKDEKRVEEVILEKNDSSVETPVLRSSVSKKLATSKGSRSELSKETTPTPSPNTEHKKKLLAGATLRRSKPKDEKVEQPKDKSPEAAKEKANKSMLKTLGRSSSKNKSKESLKSSALNTSSEELPVVELRSSLDDGEDKKEGKRRSIFQRFSRRVTKSSSSNPQLNVPKTEQDIDVDKQFDEFLESIGVTNDKLKDLWMQEYKTTKQRQDLLKSVNKNNSKLGSSFSDEVGANALAQQLKNNPTDEALDKLLLYLRTGTVAWLKDFIDANGHKWLFETFTFELFKLDKKGITSSFEGGNGERSTKFELCITCIEEGVNNGAIGVEILKQNVEVVRNLFLAIEHVSTEQRCAIFELLAAICVMSPQTHIVVTEAVEYFKNIKLGVFRALMAELKDGIDLEFKVSILSFVNSLVVMFEDIADRVKTRGLFMSEGLGEMVESLKTDYPDPELQEQLAAFSEELENDCKEAGCIADDDSSIDPFAVLSSLWEKMKGSGAELKFLTVMEQLFKIGIPNFAVDVWGCIADTLKQISAIVHSPEGSLSGINLEDLLLKVLGKTQSGSPNVKVFRAVTHENQEKNNDNIIIIDEKPSSDSLPPLPGVNNPPPLTPPAPEGTSTPPLPPPPPLGMGGPPPPPPPPGGMGGPPPPPPPPGGMGGPPPPPPLPGMGGPPPPPLPGGMGGMAVDVSIFYDAKRPKMAQWRWNPLPKIQADKTVFKDLDVSKIKFDGKKLETLFIVENVKKPAVEKKEDAKESEEIQPVLLDRQRCTIIEIIMKRFAEPATLIKKNIVECNLDYLNLNTLSEILSLFPLKTFDAERDLFKNYQKDKSTLSRSEQFIYELFAIPNIRTKLLNLIFCLEFQQKKEEYLINMDTIKAAFDEVKTPKILKTLEYILAIGNYINNTTKQTYGFKLSSIVKLSDVRSKESGVTLLHSVVKIIEESEPELLNFVEEFDNIKSAEGAMNSCQATIGFFKKSAGDLSKEVQLLTSSEEEKMKLFFDETLSSCQEILNSYDKQIIEFQNNVGYFGETSTSDFVGFFQIWNNFANSFRAAIKFNIALAKKEALKKVREEKQKEKEKEERTLKKFADTLRVSRKNVMEIQRTTEAIEKKINDQSSNPETKVDDSLLGGRRNKPRRTPKKIVNNVVDDILENNPSFMQGPTTDIRDEQGVVKQISKGLKNKDTFSRLRGKRVAHLDGMGSSGSNLLNFDSPIDGKGTIKTDLKSSRGSEIRRQLNKQKSTLTKTDVNAFKTKKRQLQGMAIKEDVPSSENKSTSRPSLSSMKWG